MRTTAGAAGRWGLAAAVAAIVAIAFTGASEAGAADRVSACFAERGVGVEGVVTSLEALSATGWRYLGRGGVTEASGCVRVVIPVAWRSQDVRIRGARLVPDGSAVTTATTYSYARKGPGAFALGTGLLGTTIVPVAPARSVAATDGAGSPCLVGGHLELGCWLAHTGVTLPAASVPGHRR